MSISNAIIGDLDYTQVVEDWGSADGDYATVIGQISISDPPFFVSSGAFNRADADRCLGQSADRPLAGSDLARERACKSARWNHCRNLLRA